MNPMVEWIAAHALLLWALLLMLALLGGDLAWQHNARWQRRAVRLGHASTVLRWQVGVLLLLALALFFAAIALAIFGRQPSALAGFDASLAEGLRDQLPLPVLRVIAVITDLGDKLWVTAVASLMLLMLLLRRHWQLALAWAVALLGILPVNGGLKMLFQRTRPLHDHGFIIEPGWSFPSGHAFGSVVFYGMLAYVLLRLSPRFHRTIIAAAVLLIGVVGISRILLQVHYFSDVLAGYTAGAAWLVLCIGAAEILRDPTTRLSP
ncbi:phosphatase PAP2 family protein [Rhodanobacter sp. B05]|uniref:phosphatase PAP2 family protein n=1 Tax=Rhodanobacter sp. B05 TaxID=1945859 RepID=UPI000984C437|nr:phosphatase PAP2 family protein [Rhodanobacter sp. B05]